MSANDHRSVRGRSKCYGTASAQVAIGDARAHSTIDSSPSSWMGSKRPYIQSTLPLPLATTVPALRSFLDHGNILDEIIKESFSYSLYKNIKTEMKTIHSLSNHREDGLRRILEVTLEAEEADAGFTAWVVVRT